LPVIEGAELYSDEDKILLELKSVKQSHLKKGIRRIRVKDGRPLERFEDLAGIPSNGPGDLSDIISKKALRKP
jgi:hypothetical protein